MIMHLSPTSKLGYLSFKVGSCVFPCDVPHQWVAQRQVGPVSVKPLSHWPAD